MFKKVRRIAKEQIRKLYNACFNRPIGYIYMFHRVMPADGALSVIDELRVSPEYFKKFLLSRSDLQFVSLDEAIDIINGKKKINKPFGVITFDDGYEDNYAYAYPILKELNIAFTIYVSVELVNDNKPIWNYPLLIEKVIRKNEDLVLGDAKKVTCKTIEEKNAAFIHLKNWLFSLPYNSLREEFVKVLGNYLTEDIFEENTLTWQQLQVLADDPLCTIGSHTMSHCRLAITDKLSLLHELQDSKLILSERLGKNVEHLSYPYGWITDVSDEAIDTAKEIGYKSGLRSYGGPVRRKDNDLFNVKRIMVNEQQ